MLLCKQGLVLNLWNFINLMMCRNFWENMWNQKCIYQQGTLCKVCMWLYCDIKQPLVLLCFMQLSTAALELGAIKMTIPERGTILSQAIASCTALLMPPSIKSSTCVTISAAIYGSGGLINIGDFILYKSANSSSVRLCCVCMGDTVCCVSVFCVLCVWYCVLCVFCVLCVCCVILCCVSVFCMLCVCDTVCCVWVSSGSVHKLRHVN